MPTPYEMAVWWWGMCWGSAALAMEPWTSRARPPVPTRETLAAELAALPSQSTELARVTARKPRSRRS